MPYQFYIDPSVNCVFVRHFDNFHLDETLNQYREMFKHPTYKKNNLNVLKDVTATFLPPEYGFKFSSEQTPIRYKEFDDVIGKSNIAWVLGTSKDYVIMHKFTLITRFKPLHHITRKPFRTIEKAKKWLEIPPDYEIDYTRFG